MTRRLIIAFVICFPFIAFSQKKASIDVLGGVEFSSINLDNSYSWRDVKDSGKMNWRFGLNYNRQLTNKFFLKTGLRLASVGYNGAIKTLKWPSEVDSLGNWVPDPTLNHKRQYIYDFWYLDIPLAGRFEFSGKKLTPFMEAGVSPHIYLFTKEKTVTDFETTVDNKSGDDHANIKNIQLVGSFSFGVNYNASKKTQLFFQPIFRYHLTKLFDSEYEDHLFNYGVEFGIRKQLR